ncbi:hypothetical protein CHARACLAT_033362 [Characodon lateralis]|uniref:Uncharacterized protein n=1 Tax=Characodon lateralis TaxID=208331 RepID=A0ABU7DZG9_9TELE|nr:hypothetical protein [Characodon lateralis]
MAIIRTSDRSEVSFMLDIGHSCSMELAGWSSRLTQSRQSDYGQLLSASFLLQQKPYSTWPMYRGASDLGVAVPWFESQPWRPALHVFPSLHPISCLPTFKEKSKNKGH